MKYEGNGVPLNYKRIIHEVEFNSKLLLSYLHMVYIEGIIVPVAR